MTNETTRKVIACVAAVIAVGALVAYSAGYRWPRSCEQRQNEISALEDKLQSFSSIRDYIGEKIAHEQLAAAEGDYSSTRCSPILLGRQSTWQVADRPPSQAVTPPSPAVCQQRLRDAKAIEQGLLVRTFRGETIPRDEENRIEQEYADRMVAAQVYCAGGVEAFQRQLVEGIGESTLRSWMHNGY